MLFFPGILPDIVSMGVQNGLYSFHQDDYLGKYLFDITNNLLFTVVLRIDTKQALC